MIDKRLKKELEKINIPPYNIEKYEETITRMRKLNFYPDKNRMSNIDFFLNQLGFIKKETWFLKISFSVLIVYLIIMDHIDVSWIWTLIAVSGPVLCLINTKELCNIFQPGMLEIQMAAKNSFSKVIMVRLITFGIFDLIFFTFMALGMTLIKKILIWQVILYSIVPYLVMCFGCMSILNRCREENMPLYCVTWGTCLSSIILILKISDIAIYEISYFSIWILTGVVAFCSVVIELLKLLKKAGGNLNEISYRSLV